MYERTFATDINVGRKIRALSVFDFRAFLNIAMLLVESETAAELRRIMLDIVIDTINQKAGGGTKYINQREQDFIGAFLQEENYRREFTDALRDYVDMVNAKYGLYTDKIYQSIFKEKAKEYRQVLKLSEKERIRDTFYSEILTLISSYECGLASMIKEQSVQLGRKLNNWELSDLFCLDLPLYVHNVECPLDRSTFLLSKRKPKTCAKCGISNSTRRKFMKIKVLFICHGKSHDR